MNGQAKGSPPQPLAVQQFVVATAGEKNAYCG
jgi:hypothetical protein